MFDTHRSDGRPLIMGILNVTPDSFSDGGRHVRLEDACRHATQMESEGADIIDVGGESTRPGANPVTAEEQTARVVPVIRKLRRSLSATTLLSVDTRSPQVAEAALDAGAVIVNDVSGGAAPGMFDTVAARRAGLVIMHMQGTPETMQAAPSYGDVVEEIATYLSTRAGLAVQAGIAADAIALDPGIGFGKTREHNLRLLAGLERFTTLGFTTLLGTSRKRFMGAICDEDNPPDLLGATCATTAMGVAAGVRVFRVHDVRANRYAADVAWACAPYRPGTG